MTHLTLDRMLKDPSVDLALTMTATMFGLPKVTVGQARDVLAAALPAVRQVLARATPGNDREAFARMLRSMAE